MQQPADTKLKRPAKRRLPPHAALALEFCTNSKVERAGLEAAGLYALMLSYCALNKTNGRVPKTWAQRLSKRSVQKLRDVELIREEGDDHVIPDFLEFNYSREEIEAVSAYTRQLAELSWEKRRADDQREAA